MSKARNIADIGSHDVIDADADGVTVVSTGAIKVPVGTEAQRSSAVKGQFRFNSDDTTFEGYDGTAWLPDDIPMSSKKLEDRHRRLLRLPNYRTINFRQFVSSADL